MSSQQYRILGSDETVALGDRRRVQLVSGRISDVKIVSASVHVGMKVCDALQTWGLDAIYLRPIQPRHQYPIYDIHVTSKIVHVGPMIPGYYNADQADALAHEIRAAASLARMHRAESVEPIPVTKRSNPTNEKPIARTADNDHRFRDFDEEPEAP